MFVEGDIIYGLYLLSLTKRKDGVEGIKWILRREKELKGADDHTIFAYELFKKIVLFIKTYSDQ